MAGLVLGGIFLAVALSLLGKGMLLKRYERALLRRLVRTTGHVTGQASGTTRFRTTDAGGNPIDRIDTEYETSYDYFVGERVMRGRATASAPIFAPSKPVPKEITVFYDRDNPSVSRLNDRYPDTIGRAYLIFGTVVLIVAVLLASIANLDRLIRSLSAE